MIIGKVNKVCTRLFYAEWKLNRIAIQIVMVKLLKVVAGNSHVLILLFHVSGFYL